MPSRYAFVLRLFLRNGLTTDLKRTWNGECEEQGRSLKISRKNFFSGLILRFSPYIFREGASSSQYPYTGR